MRTFMIALALILVSQLPAYAQYYRPAIPRIVYPQPVQIRPGVPSAALGVRPTAAQNYNALVNNIASSIAYSRAMQRAIIANSPHPAGYVPPPFPVTYALDGNIQSPVVGNPQAEAIDLNSAKDSFKSGKYFQAVEFANMAVQVNPDEPGAHEFYSLAMFALGDYHGAALAAHAVLHCGHPAKWPTLAAWYDKPEVYHQQLRLLEQEVREHPDDPAKAFLLGYHYLMLGHQAEALAQLKVAVKLSPDDLEARKLIASLEPKATPTDSIPPVPLPQSGTAEYVPGT